MIEELKKEVLYCEDTSRLYEIMLEIAEKISDFHLQLLKSENEIEQTQVKGQISIFSTMKSIIEKRLDKVKYDEIENFRREALSNRQFRIAAEAVLKKETYKQIKDLAFINYKQFNDM